MKAKLLMAGLFTLAASLAPTVAPCAWAASGDLDPTFGNNGTVVTSFGRGDTEATSVAIQPNGKIVVAGFRGLPPPDRRNELFVLARYRADGTLDPAFGKEGKVRTDLGPYADRAYGVAIQPGGKIVVAGYSDAGPVVKDSDFALVRYRADGTLDPTFGQRGKVITSLHPGSDLARSVVVQPDGRILAVGQALEVGFALARYDPDGTLDKNFGRRGKILTRFGTTEATGSSVALQVNGKVVVAGTLYDGRYRFALARYDPDGALDPTFGSGGKVVTSIGPDSSQAEALAIQSDGKIIVAGSTGYTWSDSDFALARFNTDGTLDATFDTDGTVSTSFGPGSDQAYGLTVQGDGKIVAVGEASPASFALARYDPDGSLDPTFSSDGMVVTSNGHTANAAVIQSNGKLVVAGYSYRSSDVGDRFTVARYLG